MTTFAHRSQFHAAGWTCRIGTAPGLRPTWCHTRANASSAITNTHISDYVTCSVVDAWSTDVWSFPAAARPVHHAHVVYGLPPRLGDLLMLNPNDLHPVNINKATMQQYLQTQLMSRQASKQAVQAILLNGPYLPSQLDFISDLASKLQLRSSWFLSAQQLHLVICKQPELQYVGTSVEHATGPQQHTELTWTEFLTSVLEINVQPLPAGRLTAAQEKEQLLIKQLRLFSPVTFSSALQQKLLTKKRVQAVIAIRSLMSPAALSSVRELISKVGLYLLEIERELPGAGASNRRRSSSSNGGSRRRIKAGGSSSRTKTQSEDTSGSGTVCQSELVLLVSVVPFEPEELDALPECIEPTAFTDYVPEWLEDAKAEDKQTQGSWWKWKLDTTLGRWFVREAPLDA